MKSTKIGPIIRWTNERGEHTLLVETQCYNRRAGNVTSVRHLHVNLGLVRLGTRNDDNEVIGGYIVSLDRLRRLVKQATIRSGDATLMALRTWVTDTQSRLII